MLRAYVDAPANLSRAMGRVAKALTDHAGGRVKVVGSAAEADLVVLHVIGPEGLLAEIDRLRAHGQRYAVIQYCVKTTTWPAAARWLDVWRGAEAVFSYYDLVALLAAEGVSGDGVRFYHAPLGAEPAVFRPTGDQDCFDILTSGYVMETEGVLEANAAVRAMGGKQFHLGPGDRRFGREVTQQMGINDRQLAKAYSQSRYVAGLRRVEGFELPAAEGLLCGARPVMFDAPHYRQWFGPWAVFIPEGPSAEVAASLQAVLAETRPVTDEERAAAAKVFDWAAITAGFWDTIVPPVQVVVAPEKPLLLWVGDAAVATGYARATHYTCGVLAETHRIAILGLNYYGDPHPDVPHQLYSCRTPTGGDFFGLEKLPLLVAQLEPATVVIQNDPWNFPGYLKALEPQLEALDKTGRPRPRLVGTVAVDGKNCRGYALNGLDLAIFWTRFGEQEARRGGFEGTSAVVPLGVDLDIYRPRDRQSARAEVLSMIPQAIRERMFVAGNVNRNQPRKRLDLTVEAFCEWVKTRGVDDAYLYLHIAPTGERGYDVRQLMQYHGVKGRLIVGEPEIGQGDPEELLARVYACFDVLLSTTQGEGMGLTTLEAMACGVACAVPDWAALGDWARPAAHLIPCTATAATPNQVNVIGGVPDRAATVEALDRLYRDRAYREGLAASGLALARRAEYRWRAVGEGVRDAIAAPQAALQATEALA